MTQTTQNQRIKMTGKPYGLSAGPVAAGIKIPHGTMVFIDAATGHRTNTPDSGANKYAGIAHGEADNSAGASGGEVSVEYYAHGNRFELPFNDAIAESDVGSKVYAQDNYGLSTTSTDATLVGRLEKFNSTGEGLVDTDFAAQDAIE